MIHNQNSIECGAKLARCNLTEHQRKHYLLTRCRATIHSTHRASITLLFEAMATVVPKKMTILYEIQLKKLVFRCLCKLVHLR